MLRNGDILTLPAIHNQLDDPHDAPGARGDALGVEMRSGRRNEETESAKVTDSAQGRFLKCWRGGVTRNNTSNSCSRCPREALVAIDGLQPRSSAPDLGADAHGSSALSSDPACVNRSRLGPEIPFKAYRMRRSPIWHTFAALQGSLLNLLGSVLLSAERRAYEEPQLPRKGRRVCRFQGVLRFISIQELGLRRWERERE